MQASIRWSHSTLASRLRPIAVQHNQPAISHSSSMQQQACQDISPLWQQVVAVYDKAQEIGAATKTETKVQECEDNGIRFVLRVASALKSKPKGLSGSKDQSTSGEGPPHKGEQQPPSNHQQHQQHQQQQPPHNAGFRNPFLPYEEDLWVTHLSDTHTLLLNKFNVVPHHVLVVTRQFESQQDPLNARDFAATQQVLAAMPLGGVAFYNCGEHSGRSQPHKHVQIVPLPFNEQHQGDECDTAAAGSGPPVLPLVMAAAAAADAQPLQPFSLQELPFRAYAVALQESTPATAVEAASQELLSLCQAGLPKPVSYNVVMSSCSAGSFLLMAPRRQETCGKLAINSLGFAGTILVRSEEDLQFAMQQGPLSILAEIGQPWASEKPSLL